MGQTAIILSGGGPAPRPGTLPHADLVVAADSGLHLADELGLRVDLIVGDLDSATPEAVEAAVAAGAVLEAHPADKDATDLELAIQAAVDRGADRIIVAGGGAGRLDHLLGVALLLAAPRWMAASVEWHTAGSVGHVANRRLLMATRPGDLVSLLPVTPTAIASISGTRWELDSATLEFGSTRGMSNVATGDEVEITVRSGRLLVIHTPQP